MNDKIKTALLGVSFGIAENEQEASFTETPKATYILKSYDLPKYKRNDGKGWGGGVTVKNLTKIGRNELCSCGSGKKYKKCCLLNL